MIDYSKAKIYTIRCRSNPEHIYVGSTVNPLYKRLGGHKTDSKRKTDYLLYKTIDNDWADWYIELYENYPCDTKEHLLKREGEIIREISTLNTRIEGRTRLEYRQVNVDKINEYQKNYRQVNSDKIREKKKENYKANAEKIKEQKKEYYLANAEKKKEFNKEYYLTNAIKIKEQKKEYRLANADKIKERKREYYQRKKLEKQNTTL